MFGHGSPGEWKVVTIGGGSVHCNTVQGGGMMRVDTEAAAATDTLNDITGGKPGSFWVLRAANTARTVTLGHEGGSTDTQLHICGAADFDLDDTERFALAFKTHDAGWFVIPFDTQAANLNLL